MVSVIVPPNTTLIRLVVNAPGRFHNQDWYYDEEFAHVPILKDKLHISPSILYTAAEAAFIHIVKGPFLPDKFAWTSDHDYKGDRVYVGGWNLGRTKGFQIHRHLTIRPEMFVNSI